MLRNVLIAATFIATALFSAAGAYAADGWQKLKWE
jgi:hypothetical protein